MLDSLTSAFAAFGAAALVIAVAGTYLARYADELADRTGLGEAIIGTFLLASATSLPDFAATLSAAVDARPELAMSNVMGSMAVNLLFLGIADISYREANLEHAAASSSNLAQAALLIALLSVPLIAAQAPEVALFGVHPASPLIVAAYVFGFVLIRRTQESPMWFPRRTPLTVIDRPASEEQAGSVAPLWLKFLALTLVTALAGWLLMEAVKTIADRTALSENVAGGVLTAVSTSSPELVTTLAAIRAGALTLAVSNIIGTNCFNILVIAAADLAYRQGSIYHDISSLQVVWGLVAILMTAVLLLGMVRRQVGGFGNIGFESVVILAVYTITVILVILNA